jgi:hypothetical protein
MFLVLYKYLSWLVLFRCYALDEDLKNRIPEYRFENSQTPETPKGFVISTLPTIGSIGNITLSSVLTSQAARTIRKSQRYPNNIGVVNEPLSQTRHSKFWQPYE